MTNKSLFKNPANYENLNPVSFLKRSAQIYPDNVSVIYNEKRFTWGETLARCESLARALSNVGLVEGDVIGYMAVNTPELYEGHFGVPMAGMVLNALNYRLDPKTIAFIIDHSEIKLLIVDREFSSLVGKAVGLSKM